MKRERRIERLGSPLARPRGWLAGFFCVVGEIEVEEIDLSGVSIRHPNAYRQT